jgi:hypothetical protein
VCSVCNQKNAALNVGSDFKKMNVLITAFTSLLRLSTDPIKSDEYMVYILELEQGLTNGIKTTPERIVQLNQIIKNDSFKR